MKDLTPVEMEIKNTFPDMLKMVVEFDSILSKREIEKEGREIAASLQTYLLRYEHSAKAASFYFSRQAKDIVMNMEVGQQVTFVQYDVAGNIVPSLCKLGELVAFNGGVWVSYIGGDACVKVEIADKSDWYAIYNLAFDSQRSLIGQRREGGAL